MIKRHFVILPALVGLSLLACWGALRVYSATASTGPAGEIPCTAVQRGDVAFIVHAKGELQGGNTEVLSAPQVGGQALTITSLRESGDLVKPGDTVVEFDTTDEEYTLREAESDLAEAEKAVIQARAERNAKEEEARYALLEARAELLIAEVETRRNSVLPAIVAKQNDLAVAAARDQVNQLEKDLADRIRSARAGVTIQEAARQRARVAADTARRNIEMMTLTAKTEGYVAVQQNQESNGLRRWGRYLPSLQVGDAVRAGVPVVEIPDLRNWEASVRIGELDRAYLEKGQPAAIEVVALPRRKFSGRIIAIGGTSGPPWDRHFETRVALDNPTPELRPGMSVRLRITTEVRKNVLWLPSQAVFEAGGRKFVYAKTGASFSPRDIALVRRSESQAVIQGLGQGQLVALAHPDQAKKQPIGSGGALQAIPQ